MWKKMKVKTKLILVNVVIVGLAVFCLVASISFIQKLNVSVDQFNEEVLPFTNEIWSIRKDITSIEANLADMLLSEDTAYNNQLIQDNKVLKEQINASIAEVEALTEAGQFDSIFSSISDLGDIRNRVEAARISSGWEEGKNILYNEYKPQSEIVRNNLLSFADLANEGSQAQIAENQKTASRGTKQICALSLFYIIFSIFAVRAIIKNIMHPLNEIGKAAKGMSDGILSTEIHYSSGSEFGELADSIRDSMKTLSSYVGDIDAAMELMATGDFRVAPAQPFVGDFENIERSISQFIVHMSDTITQITEAADQLTSGANLVADGAQELAQGAAEQAGAVEELSGTIVKVSDQVNKNAQYADDINAKANEVGERIQMSNQQMMLMLEAMENISEKSSEIGKIIKTIDDIAFQTNILALNAAVEAARAGEAGKGFAVVADEVRNLASKSSEAANETTALIEDSIAAVKTGTSLASEAAHSLNAVVEGAAEITVTIGEMAKSSREQAAAIVEIRSNANQIESVVQTNSANAEESAATSEELSGQAQSLKNVIGRFKVN